LKIAKVCPIFKSGSEAEFTNYRPISVLPSFSKVYEKIVYNRLLSFLTVNNILIDNKYGFRKSCSSYMALLDLHERNTASIDAQHFALGIFIDLQKAFETINHKILISNLE